MSYGNGMVISVGCDPELFVKEKATNKFVSAHTLLPGTKEKPHPVIAGAVQVDGVAAEFNIEPVFNTSGWEDNITSVMTQLKAMLPKHMLSIVPAVVFEPTYFYSLPESVRELGCNMDYNAWTGQPNPQPQGGSTTMRTASGHIHIGGWADVEDPKDSAHIEDCCYVAQQLDYFLGIPSLVWDNDARRRELYGQGGAFRPKTYGLEYRTLSNRWLMNKHLREYVFRATLFAVNNLVASKPLRMTDKHGNLAQKLINENQYEYVRSQEFRKEIWEPTGAKWPVWDDAANMAMVA